MINYELPRTLLVDGRSIPIRYDYRCCLDIVCAFQDRSLDDKAKSFVMLKIIYNCDPMPASESALNEAAWFLNGGRTYAKTGSNSSPKLIDWEQDFDLIVAAISRNIGCDIRGISLHWWTFLAYFGEIGESVFARVVGIRQKKLRGKKLDEQEREFARANRDLIVFQKIAKEPDSELLQFLGIN